jgi:hypothetical protein
LRKGTLCHPGTLGKEMTKPLADDILYAISCIQDYRDTIEINSELWHEIGDRIERLFQFYYQLIGI